MKKKITLILSLLMLTLFVGCREAEMARYNLAKEADNFNCRRRVTVINCITGETLLTVEGLCSITADTADHQLEIIIEYQNGKYKKDIVGLSDNVTYLVEDLDWSDVDPYNYSVNFNPNLWIPVSGDYID